MKDSKLRIVCYVTSEEKERIQKRAKELKMPVGTYFHELSMWDSRFNLIPQLRKGGSITCNGNTKKT